MVAPRPGVTATLSAMSAPCVMHYTHWTLYPLSQTACTTLTMPALYSNVIAVFVVPITPNPQKAKGAVTSTPAAAAVATASANVKRIVPAPVAPSRKTIVAAAAVTAPVESAESPTQSATCRTPASAAMEAEPTDPAAGALCTIHREAFSASSAPIILRAVSVVDGVRLVNDAIRESWKAAPSQRAKRA